MKSLHPSSLQRGFTLIELITVVSVIVILFSLVAGGYTYADRASKRNRTEVTVRAIQSGLNNYKEAFGSFPSPANPSTPIAIADVTYIAGEAACLYQAMSGDGFDQIQGAEGSGPSSSNGDVDDTETTSIMLKDMPREIWKQDQGLYFMVDGFGHPIRYMKALPVVSATPGQAPPAPITVNAGTYDIWSYGDDTENTRASSLEAVESETVRRTAAKWIKNW